jgi:hypothetical protein
MIANRCIKYSEDMPGNHTDLFNDASRTWKKSRRAEEENSQWKIKKKKASKLVYTDRPSGVLQELAKRYRQLYISCISYTSYALI